jgi:hypothetical protein
VVEDHSAARGGYRTDDPFPGVLGRLPDLRIYFAETNASWIPGLLYMVDDSYQIFRHWYGVELAMKPNEYVRRHFFFGIVRDPLALAMRGHPDLDRITWGSDFPHSVSSFPETRRWLDEIFEGCPAGVRQQVLVDNPCRFWHLDPAARPSAAAA